jgi:hypothetical protein
MTPWADAALFSRAGRARPLTDAATMTLEIKIRGGAIMLRDTPETQRFLERVSAMTIRQRARRDGGPSPIDEHASLCCVDGAAEWESALACADHLERWSPSTVRQALSVVSLRDDM